MAQKTKIDKRQQKLPPVAMEEALAVLSRRALVLSGILPPTTSEVRETDALVLAEFAHRAGVLSDDELELVKDSVIPF